MKKRTTTIAKTFLGFGLIAMALSSCKKDEDLVKVPEPDLNESEVITTFKITFADVNGSQPTVSASFIDLDGDGGNPPSVFDTIYLAPSTTYSAEILLLNEAANPTDTISNEVLDEAVDHLFCFTPSGANVSITRTDSDGVYELGLQSQWITGAASDGTTQIVLKHQPGIKDGSCSPGETDIELNFNTKIQ